MEGWGGGPAPEGCWVSKEQMDKTRARIEQLEAEVRLLREAGPNEVVLRLSWRDDGGLTVASPTFPNLYLSHSQADLVMQDVLPALEVMGFRATLSEGE